MNNGNYLQVPLTHHHHLTTRVCDGHLNEVDEYTAAIELSNKCREFYKSRVEAADSIKSRWNTRAETMTRRCYRSSQEDNTEEKRRKKTSIDEAMEKLRSEMASLMDQDLSLMKQLLTLNETIEELKWQRQYYNRPSNSSGSMLASSSNWSVSDTDMYQSDDHHNTNTQHTIQHINSHKTKPVPVNILRENFQSLHGDQIISLPETELKKICTSSDKKSNRSSNLKDSSYDSEESMSKLIMKKENIPTVVIHHDRDQQSFDSGFHDCIEDEKTIWAV